MEDQAATIIGAIIVIAIIIAAIQGAVKTFQRNWILALVLLIFLFPIWLIWAFVEIFTGEIVKSATLPNQILQNVNISYAAENVGATRAPRISSYSNAETIELLAVDSEGKTIASTETKECPFCAEVIKQNAVYCRFCSKELQNGK